MDACSKKSRGMWRKITYSRQVRQALPNCQNPENIKNLQEIIEIIEIIEIKEITKTYDPQACERDFFLKFKEMGVYGLIMDFPCRYPNSK